MGSETGRMLESWHMEESTPLPALLIRWENVEHSHVYLVGKKQIKNKHLQNILLLAELCHPNIHMLEF